MIGPRMRMHCMLFQAEAGDMHEGGAVKNEVGSGFGRPAILIPKSNDQALYSARLTNELSSMGACMRNIVKMPFCDAM
jgi:hypothetical protein